ncbi:3-methyl-2-oxobutanoate hydroxymethyltransferase [Egicoccus sp. AB-alg2]|uniref:3-methyl-2-oxobutanoate hydroxymethyltransferase n=1 Tax=Egicoccus sp. AB-alg2 TaxID=3242693 RepID=UPI00359D93D3
MTQRQPILLNTSAVASSAREAAFRIDFNDFEPRASRVIALDGAAAEVVRRLAAGTWAGGRFLLFDELVDDGGERDATLRTIDGQPRRLIEELEDSDVVVMIATAEARPEAAAVVGDAAAARPVMSAALVLAENGDAEVEDAVAVLRPNAMVMLLLHDEQDVGEVLSALRV